MKNITIVGEIPYDGEACLKRALGLAKITDFNIEYLVQQSVSWAKVRGLLYETVEEPTYTKTGKLSKVTKKVVRPTQRCNDWKADLISVVERQRPNIVVGLGSELLRAFTSFDSIEDYRGSVLPGEHGLERKVLCTYSPGQIVRGNTGAFWILAHDLAKAKRESEYAEIRREPFISRFNPDHSIESVIRDLEYIAANPRALWTLDVETRAGTLACFAIGCYMDRHLYGFCVPVQTTTGPYWSHDDELRMWKALKHAARVNPNLCNQNIEYDIYYLLMYDVEPSGVYMDTMLAHSILHPEFPKSLDFLASWYLDDVVFWKSDHRDWTGRTPDEALWEYNVKDAVYTLRIVERIDEELKKRKLWEAYHGN